LWKTTGLFLLLGGLIVALLGVMTAMFEQVDRRAEERLARERARRKPGY
jgi:predicted outer membrane lipoprotein